MSNIEKSIKKLEMVNQWISNCDTKSSFILTFYGVIITIIFTSSTRDDIVDTLHLSVADKINLKSIILFTSLILVLAFMFSIAATGFYILQTLKGRIDPEVYRQQCLNTNSNIFFGTIASKAFATFKKETNEEDEDAYLNDINSQIFINSKIATEKFKNYNSSLFWMVISFAMFLLYALTK